jgi:transposase
MNFTTVGLDLAKNVFQAHGASSSGAVVFEGNSDVCGFRRFASQHRCLVAMEVCASSHFWARAIVELGHDVRLIPSTYVKPFVKRQSDMADAEAICEAG